MQEVEEEHNVMNVKVSKSTHARLFKHGNAGMNVGQVVKMILDHYESCPNKGDR